MGGTPGAVVALVAALVAAPATAHGAAPMRDVIVTLQRQATVPDGGAGAGAVEAALRRAADRSQGRVLALLERRRAAGEVRRVQPFWIVDAVEVVATSRVLADLRANPDVASVRPNTVLRAPARARLAAAPTAPPAGGVAQIGAPALWRAGITGSGVTVASLDSGVDASHPALASAFRGGPGSWFDPSGQHPGGPVDTSGHGTATLGIVLGNGAGGTAIGVAPDARWIAAKVFDDRGRTTVARIHAALQWVLDPDGNPRTADAPQVVNASWDSQRSGCDLEFEADLRHLRAAGILPVFSAGNGGEDASPANDPSAFAVGSVDADGVLAPGSGRGPSSCGGGRYPGIVAPGVDILTSDVAGLYTTQSGTSVAAPHASGALALLLSRFPKLSALRQQSALESGAADLGTPGADDSFGFGRLDVAASYGWLARTPDVTLTPDRWALAVGKGRSAAVRVKVGAVHGFTGPVRLTIAGLPRGVRGAPVRIGLRGGARPVRLRLTTTSAARPGSYPVTVLATAGTRTRRLALGLDVRR